MTNHSISRQVIIVDSSVWIDLFRNRPTLDAIDAAKNYRRLRRLGVTVRGTVDVLIATRCMADGLRLLHSDRDVDAFEQHLGLRVVDCEA